MTTHNTDPVDLWLLHEPGDADVAALAEALTAEGLRVSIGPPLREPRALLLAHRGAAAQAAARLRTLREHWPQALLLLRCPAPREVDEVLALEMGADAVLAESLAAVVLAARWRALMRWHERLRPPPAALDGERGRRLAFGRLEIDRDRRRAALAGREVPLTEGEFEVLWLLASHSGEPLSRSELQARLRGTDQGAGGDQRADRGRSIDSRVYRLRGKLGGGGTHGGIRTVRHRGYLFTPSAW